ncbi:MAG: hypothetical protein ACREAE_08420 [Nitrosopumilaceae archaeon]
MRIPSGSTDRKMFFVAVDSTDLKTRETGLTSFTVYRSRDGGAATAYTTPTVAELSAANMPGVYVLTLDEDTTIGASHDDEEYCVHITQASMAPVTRSIDIYRVKFTEGQSATVANSAVDVDVERWLGTVVATPTTAGVPEVDVTHVSGTVQTAGDIIADTNDIQVRLPAALISGRIDASVGAMAAGVVTAAAVATNAIDADALAADAVIEIQAGLATSAALATVQTDTDDIQARLPAALVGGRMASNAEVVGDKTEYTLSAAGIDSIWDEVVEGAATVRQFLRGFASAMFGKSNSHQSGTPKYRDIADTKDRISATTDANGNRTAITTDLT